MNAGIKVREWWEQDKVTMQVTIPIKTVSETNMREHHMARHRRRKGQRETTGLVCAGVLAFHRQQLGALRNGPLLAVTLERIAPRALDDDNLRGALKAVRDGVADALGVDDGETRIAWEYGQERGRPKEYAVRISVRAA